MSNKTVYGQVESDKLDRPRLTLMKPSSKDDEGGKTGTCAACGKELMFQFKPCGERLISVACDNKCARDAGYFEHAVIAASEYVASEPVQRKKKEKRGPCPDCGGPPSRRGWKHEDGCSNTGLARAKARLAAKSKEKKAEKDEAVSDDSEDD